MAVRIRADEARSFRVALMTEASPVDRERHSIETASAPDVWFRWNGRVVLVVFLSGIAMLWLALALLYTLEIQ
jgi:hypothetical protein